MFSRLSKYFGFSRMEIYGIMVLGIIILFFLCSPSLYRVILSRSTHLQANHIAEVEHFAASLYSARPAHAVQPHAEEAAVDFPAAAYFVFDPNGLSIADWKQLGLSDRQIRVIKNYEANGGRFRKPEDLKKIYSINDADYARLAPYIHIKEPARTDRQGETGGYAGESVVVGTKPSGKAALYLNLNEVDSVALQQLPGIGPVFASRIVRFRDRLGGFHDIAQLLDVYGMDDDRYAKLKDHVYADAAMLKQLNPNSASYEQLKAHPFISPKQANAIVQYRRQHGNFHSGNDLLRIAIIDEDFLHKIAPYITFDDDRPTTESSHP